MTVAMDYDDDDLPAGFGSPWARIVDHVRRHGVQRSKTSQPMRGARAYPVDEKPKRDWNSPAHLRAALKYARKMAADPAWRAKRNAARRRRYAERKDRKR